MPMCRYSNQVKSNNNPKYIIQTTKSQIFNAIEKFKRISHWNFVSKGKLCVHLSKISQPHLLTVLMLNLVDLKNR